MIVFYTQNKSPQRTLEVTTCKNVCTSACMQPKGKCCNKYKKKGINCKRCPLTFLQEAS